MGKFDLSKLDGVFGVGFLGGVISCFIVYMVCRIVSKIPSGARGDRDGKPNWFLHGAYGHHRSRGCELVVNEQRHSNPNFPK